MELTEQLVKSYLILDFAHLTVSFNKTYLIMCQCLDNGDFHDIFYFLLVKQMYWLIYDIGSQDRRHQNELFLFLSC